MSSAWSRNSVPTSPGQVKICPRRMRSHSPTAGFRRSAIDRSYSCDAQGRTDSTGRQPDNHHLEALHHFRRSITADDLLRWSIGLAQSNWRRRLLLSRLLLGWLLFGRLLFGGHYYRGSVCIRTRGSGAAGRATAHPLPGLWIDLYKRAVEDGVLPIPERRNLGRNLTLTNNDLQ